MQRCHSLFFAIDRFMRVAHARSITAIATDSQSISTTSTPISITVANATTQVYYIHTDQLNTPRLITNQANAKVWEWNNDDPFANNAPNDDPNSTGNHFEFNHRFAGQYADKETNIHYNYYRDYDPATGRYVESDPIGLEGGINTYAYVGGNPLSGVDPNGLARVCNYTNHPVVVSGGAGGPNGDGKGQGGYTAPVVLQPKECIGNDSPKDTYCGDDKLKDVDAVDFNGDGIAESPKTDKDYLYSTGNGEKVPGNGSWPTLNLHDNAVGSGVWRYHYTHF